VSSAAGSEFDRRTFLLAGLQGGSAAWVALHWPAIMEAAEHAAHMRQVDPPPKFAVLSTEQAAVVEAVASRIIPSDASPGAREAGVIFFIDRALATFSTDSRDTYQQGLPVFDAKTREMFATTERFSQATSEQQDTVLKAMEGQPIFELIRTHTIMGFLADPERGGNRNESGWKLIAFDPSPVFTPPFGDYDRGYQGWQPPAKVEENK
jgi:gluconate 2-dehydrogenase gamma chain